MTPVPIVSAPALPDPEPAGLSLGTQWLLSVACGLLAANLYYPQPLLGLMAASMGVAPQNAGLFMMLPLIGYGMGLLAIVPAGDLLENRRLVLVLVGLEALWLIVASLTVEPAFFLGVGLLVGATASAVQILVPYVTYLSPEAIRGRVVGKVVSGLMLGIMLARPVASVVADLWSWRAVYRLSAVLMAFLFAALWLALPARTPAPGLSYRGLLASMGRIFLSTRALRRRALYHACMFGAFSAFWTAVPLWLSGPAFGLSQRDIAWVALAGVAGAIAPPIAGRIADRGFSQWGTALAMLLGAAAFLLSDVAGAHSSKGLGLIVGCAILLDFAVSANLVFQQRAIFSLGSEERSRMNGLFMASFFVSGAISSALSAWCYVHFGWRGVSILGAGLPLIGLAAFLTEGQPRRGTVAEPV